MVLGYRKIYGEFADEEVDKIITAADVDGNGEIDYSEWLMTTINRKQLVTNEKLRNAFNFFDKDGSGQI